MPVGGTHVRRVVLWPMSNLSVTPSDGKLKVFGWFAVSLRLFSRSLRSGWAGQLLVAAVLVAVAATQISLEAFALAFAGIRYEWLGLAVLIYVAGRLINAWEWQILIKQVGRAPLFGLLGVLLIGTLVNAIFPANLGDVAKIQIAANRYSLSRAGLVAGRGAEAVVNGAIFVCFALVSVALVGGVGTFTLLWLLVPSAALFVGAVAVSRAMSTTLPQSRVLGFVPRRLHTFLEHHWPRFHEGLDALRSTRVLLRLGLLGLIGWTIDIAISWAYGTAFNLDLSLSAYLALTVLLALITTFPITFGNVGSWEFGIVGVLALYGVPAERALAFGVATHMFITILNLAIGLVALGWMRVSLREVLMWRKSVHLKASSPSIHESVPVLVRTPTSELQ